MCRKHETLLVVVGRGASDPDANSNVSKVTRLLWEGFGFGWAETAYSGVTFPLVEPALEHAAKLGYRRIVVFPYFLFTGILVQRIYDATDAVAKRHPGIQFVKAPYLNDHPLVIDTFEERIDQILTGDTAMNCQMCKYRTQVLGFEAEVGCRSGEPPPSCGRHRRRQRPQSRCRDHGDGARPFTRITAIIMATPTPPYPHADHPLGPRSMKKN